MRSLQLVKLIMYSRKDPLVRIMYAASDIS